MHILLARGIQSKERWRKREVGVNRDSSGELRHWTKAQYNTHKDYSKLQRANIKVQSEKLTE